jgi:hypothetical protein
VSGNLLALTIAVKLGLLVAGVVGVYLLVRSYDAPPAAAYVAGVLVPMGGVTQYLDLPSWAAAEMIWALLPWAWWGLRRTMRGANPLPALVAGYLVVTVGYVYGTIMLVLVVLVCLLDCGLARDRRAALRVLVAGLLLGLVAVTVYLPGVLTASTTARVQEYGPVGKLTTDPLAVFGSVLPTGVAPGSGIALRPYGYIAWLLPLLLWLDWGAVRRGWRPLSGLAAYTVLALVMVDWQGEVGPLRYPMRLLPFLVLGAVVLVTVGWSRFGPARPSAARLVLSLAWVGLAAIESVTRESSHWAAQVWSVLVVGGGLALVWWLLRTRGGSWWAPAVGVVTVAAFALQHVSFGTPPSPQRNAPTSLAAYQDLYPQAVGDLMQVGASEHYVQTDPRAAAELPIGSAWYLTGIPSSSTYTAISNAAYKDRYCVYYQGNSCPTLLTTLFSTEPTTGQERVDLLGLSSLLVTRRYYPASVVDHPPAGWRIAEHTPYAALWTRRTPIAGAGSVAWTSPGTSVSAVRIHATSTSFRVDDVPAAGGTVVLRLLDWPGYSASGATIAPPVDGYLLTVHVTASQQGRTVEVAFHPPGWTAEVGAWALALVVGLAWSVTEWGRRRRAATGAGPEITSAG